ncbi:MAG: hypothetical protein J6P72_06050 [Firmicutes bacterium]|nr:hypothetical protein [Bacillota bacterium]
MSGEIRLAPAALYVYARRIRANAAFEEESVQMDLRQTLYCLETLRQTVAEQNVCLHGLETCAQQEAAMLDRIARDFRMADHVAALRMEGGFADAGE